MARRFHPSSFGTGSREEITEEKMHYHPNAYINWKQLRMSLATAPIEVRIAGDEIPEIKQVATKVSDIFREIESAQWIRTDYKEPLQTVRLDLKEDEASRLGFSKSLIDYSLLGATAGFPVSTIWEDDYPLSVNLRVKTKTKTSTDEIMNQYITSQFMVSAVQVRQLVDIKPEWSEGEIARRNGIRTITVMVDIARGGYATEVFNNARPLIDKLELPEGVSISYGGDYETNVEEVTPLYYSMAVSVAIVFIILLFQFRSIKIALLIMVTMPLSIFGAAVGIMITGYPFGVTALVGIIGLMGIIVRNGIIYISYAEELRWENGLSLENAAISAAKRRMRPIFLTSAAAASGVVPMILSGSSLWGPLGSIICFGLLFGMVLSLLLLPVLYYLLHKNDTVGITESEPA